MVSFYLPPGTSRVRATALVPTAQGYKKETFFPTADVLESIKISKVITDGRRKRTDLHIYEMLDIIPSSNPNFSQVSSVRKVNTPYNKIFQTVEAVFNDTPTIVKVLPTIVPHVVWVNKKDLTVHLLRGGEVIKDEEGIPFFGQFDSTMPIELLKSFASVKDIDRFRGELYDANNAFYNHLGFLKVLFVQGRTGGILYKLGTEFLRTRVAIQHIINEQL